MVEQPVQSTKVTSLKTRLVLILLALTLAAWGASALVTAAFTNRVMLDQVDRQLEQYAGLVNYISTVFARQVDEGVPLSEPWLQGKFETAHLEPIVIAPPAGEQLSPAVNIWLDRNLIAVMANSPRFEEPLVEGFTFGGVASGDSNWRILARYDELTGLWLQVGMEMGDARRAMLSMLGRALLPLLIVLPMTIALLYYGVSRGLKPLKNLADQISQRNPVLLDPVDPRDVPAEMQGVVSSLNGLLQRLAMALEGEQRFTANAAHELLTPLAAIKTEVQLCQLQLDDERSAAMLARIVQRVDRASHTVSQLLTLARFDPEQAVAGQRVCLQTLLEEALANTSHLADERGLTVAVDATDNTTILGSEHALYILFCNVLINAFRYASPGTVVQVALGGAEEVVFAVSNACSTLSRQEFERIGERFYRVPGSAGQGAGLGLSIVAHIAGQHGAAMSVGPGEAGGGFRVGVVFSGGADQAAT